MSLRFTITFLVQFSELSLQYLSVFLQTRCNEMLDQEGGVGIVIYSKFSFGK